MRIEAITFTNFRRFTNLVISDIPASARLVVLAGPNGSGKSSLFDGLRTWQVASGSGVYGLDETYVAKAGSPPLAWLDRVSVTLHDDVPTTQEDWQRAVYLRTAYRHEAEFDVQSVTRLGSPLAENRAWRMIDPDAAVSGNYQRLLMQTVEAVYDESLPDDLTRLQLRDRVIGRVRAAMSEVFPDLMLSGVGGLTSSAPGTISGTFYFTKGATQDFPYKNLSAGEKAAFDLILDAVVKSETYTNTVWCIDEPETHLNSRVQAKLLGTLLDLLPVGSQLWLASHSIGFMRKAWEESKAHSENVAFIDLDGVNFDAAVEIRPVTPSREFWSRVLDVALGDVAALMAPDHVVLCEGRLRTGNADVNAGYDAACYRSIFAQTHPGVDFISVGSANDVTHDRLGISFAIQTIAPGTTVTRVVDRDLKSETEIAALEAPGTRTLNRRHIEAYLFDEEVLEALCHSVARGDLLDEAKVIRAKAIDESIRRGNDPDDIKRASGTISTKLRSLLGITGAGSTAEAFSRDTLAPLVKPGMDVFEELRVSIFG